MKKIFAVVLSLCLVLSTFVAVSAQEQVYVEGNEVTLFDISKNFDATDAEVLYGTGIAGAQVADPAGERAGMVAGGAISSGSYGYIGFELPVNSISAGDVVEISLDVYSSAEWQAGAGSTQGVMLRAGDYWVPSGTWQQVLAKETVAANTWTTLTNTYTMPADVYGTGIWLQVRPNVVLDYFYIDNLSIKVTGGREAVVDMNMSMDDASTGLLKASSVGTVTYADGIATVENTASGNNGMVGVKIVDTTGVAYALTAGDVVEWEMRINPSASITPNDLTGVLMRNGGSSYPPSSSPFKQIAEKTAIPANTWTTLSGEWAANETYSGTAYLNFRADAAVTLKVDYIKVKIVKSATMVEAGWADADYSINYTAVKSDSSKPGTLTGNVYTATLDEFEAFYSNGNCSYNPWVNLNTNIPVGTKFKLSYDLTTEGINNSVGGAYSTLTVRARFYNASNSEINSSYRPNASVTANTGEAVHYELTVDPTQLTQDVASVRIVVDVDTAAKNALNDEGAYLTISNWDLKLADSFVTVSAEKTTDGIELTLANANAEKYKFSGRVLIAEYETVDGVKELVQFAEAEVSEEINANGETVVTVSFDGEIASGNAVHVFVWEPASFEAIQAVEVL